MKIANAIKALEHIQKDADELVIVLREMQRNGAEKPNENTSHWIRHAKLDVRAALETEANQ